MSSAGSRYLTLSVQLNSNGANVNSLTVEELNHACAISGHICCGWIYTKIAFSGSYSGGNVPLFYVPELPAPLGYHEAYIYRLGGYNSMARYSVNQLRSYGISYKDTTDPSFPFAVNFCYVI